MGLEQPSGGAGEAERSASSLSDSDKLLEAFNLGFACLPAVTGDAATWALMRIVDISNMPEVVVVSAPSVVGTLGAFALFRMSKSRSDEVPEADLHRSLYNKPPSALLHLLGLGRRGSDPHPSELAPPSYGLDGDGQLVDRHGRRVTFSPWTRKMKRVKSA